MRCKRSYTAAILGAWARPDAQAFQPAPAVRRVDQTCTATANTCRVRRSSAGGARWASKSQSEARSGVDRSRIVGSNEDNNWGMDPSIDANAIRMKMMEQAGYRKRDDSKADAEWMTIDEDGSDGTTNQTREYLSSSLGGGLLGAEGLQAADASQLVEELIEDDDIAKFFDEEFDKGASALRALADELKGEQVSTSYADTMVKELAKIFEAEEEKAALEIEQRRRPVQEKLIKATAELEEAMADAQEARRSFESDILLQLLSFRQKGPLRQAAFVAAVLIANQGAYQGVLVVDDRGGNPALALGEFVASAALIWVYGYRPFSFK